MSVHITFTNAPEYYTNLDIIEGKVVVFLPRPEAVGAVIVKLEGESRTSLSTAASQQEQTQGFHDNGNVVQENHKILYKVAQVFPDEKKGAQPPSAVLLKGQHEFPFRFKIPFNNGCSDPAAMARIGGLVGEGGYGVGPSIFGMGGIRVMDGSKQLLFPHVTKTLPPSFTGFPGMAEVRYFVKVTVQRPGLFKENWRHTVGFKFLPIEPPRPQNLGQEAYARRPFTFRPESPRPELKSKKKSSFFAGLGGSGGGGASRATDAEPTSPTAGSSAKTLQDGLAPSVEVSARLPYPAILTCNKPIPLRIVTKKLVPSREVLHLVSLQIDLISSTNIRCRDLINTEVSRWVVVSRLDLNVPVCAADGAVGDEFTVPDLVWANQPLPNTVMPSFVTCNLGREYRLEVKLGIAWRQQGGGGGDDAAKKKGKGKAKAAPNVIHLPLTFSAVEVYSGMTPPTALIAAMMNRRDSTTNAGSLHAPQQTRPTAAPSRPSHQPAPASAPTLPPRRPTAPPASSSAADGAVPPYEDAPPSYDEAMAETSGPVFTTTRPAYSGVTNENAPSTIPEKS